MHMTMVQGFADPALDAQAMFRLVLDAMAYPGRIVTVVSGDDQSVEAVTPGDMDRTAFKLALTLMDFETTVWLDSMLKADQPVVEALRFHCGCPITEDPGEANFALIGDPKNAPPLSAFHQGTPDYPDRATTVIMQVETLHHGRGVRLTGPGIKTEVGLGIDGIPPGFWRQWMINHKLYPLGVDLILTAGDRLAALPRSVSVEV